MKIEKNNIERIFKDKLQEFEVTPPEHLWANISQEIAPKKEQKKPLLFWFVGSSIVASFLIFTALFINFSTNTGNNTIIVSSEEEYCPEESIVDTQEDIPSENILNDTTIKNPIINKTTTPEKTHNSIKNSIVKSNDRLNESSEINNQKNNTANSFASSKELKNFIPKNLKPMVNSLDKKTIINKLSIPETEELTEIDLLALLQPEEKEEEPKKENSKKWSIEPQITTFLYNGNGSSIDSTFKNNPQDTETDLSYGIRIAYQTTPKISIRTGINNANINITTSDIGAEISVTNETGELFSNNDLAILNLHNPQDSDEIPVNITESLGDTITPGGISQQLQYFEVPIEVSYKILDKRIGIDIIGGFSTFLLNKNESSFISENNITSLGETSSINSTSFSSNIGFSFDYRLIKSLKFSIEPMLKFQLNSFNNTTDYQSYFLGISSGLKWAF